MGCTMSRDGKGLVELKDWVLKEVLSVLVLLWPSNIVARYSAKDILLSAIWATVKKSSIHRVCQDRVKGPTDKTVRTYLSIFNIKLLQKNIHKLLMIPIKDILRPSRYKFAIDLTDIPYHGEPKNSPNEIRRSKAKSGTTHFHSYASLYVIRTNKRYTLDMLRVTKNTSLTWIVDTFINHIKKDGYKIKLLYMDKGFYQVRVIRYLQRKNIPTIIPGVPRGRSGGLRKKYGGRQSYRTKYTMRSPRYKCEVTFPLYIIKKYSKCRYGRSGTKTFTYAVLNINVPVENVFEEYRSRFGIESSYRLMNSCRARTSSRDPEFRFYLMFLSFLILNYWVASKWLYVSETRKGGRKVYTDDLSSHTFCNLIDRALEKIFGLKNFLIQPKWFKIQGKI